MGNIKKHYVYEHWLDNECIYVGKGSGYRAYNFKANRCKKWFDITNNRTDDIIVKIIKYFDVAKDAFDFEEELTKKYLAIGQCKGVYKIGNINPPEARKQLSEILKIKYKGAGNPNYGKPAHNKGKKLSDEQRKKLKNNIRKNLPKVICKNNSMIFNNVYDAAEYFSIDVRTILRSCEQNKPTRKDKYLFEYL